MVQTLISGSAFREPRQGQLVYTSMPIVGIKILKYFLADWEIAIVLVPPKCPSATLTLPLDPLNHPKVFN